MPEKKSIVAFKASYSKPVNWMRRVLYNCTVVNSFPFIQFNYIFTYSIEE